MKPILPTAEEAVKIHGGDKALKDRYYIANCDFVAMVCRSYCRNHKLKNGLHEDAAQECYLYFEKFVFDTPATFIRSIKDICVYVRFGGEKLFHQYRQGETEVLTILDEPVTREKRHGGTPETLGDTIASDFDIMDEIEPPADYCDTVHDIAAAFLSPRQAQAFDYFYYTDLTAREIGERLGLTINGAQSHRHKIRKVLRIHSEEFLERLVSVGYPVENVVTL